MTDARPSPYRVLARKYRPRDFSGLVGQDALVRTLSNAISTGRLAHAFLLTGVRGVGKTSTARIIARALNCTGPDGLGGPTISPCGVCENCRAIAEDRHVDVLEMDAASHNGVDGIRDLIDGARYLPVSARYKIYIVDEVHMLSTAAFNALLKTLEEPPEHVKFILATTEIRKIPVTILSRCQRFDLRRVDMETLARHFGGIVEKEGVTVDPEAMAMICRAADGSVRDGLSLLDQAIAHGGGAVSAEEVRAMLGLADRNRIFDLYDLVMKGDIAGALAEMRDQYDAGVNPATVLSDMLETTHWLTRLKVSADDDPSASETERVKGGAMAKALSMAVLTRNWQILLKGAGEVNVAPRPLQAAEMVLVRLAFAADLPTPADALKALKDGAPSSRPAASPSTSPSPTGNGGSAPRAAIQGGASAERVASAPPQERPVVLSPALPQSFEALVGFLAEKGEMKIAAELKSAAHLVHYEIGRLDFRPAPAASPDLAQRVASRLKELTGRPWLISLSREQGQPTLRQKDLERESERRRSAAEHPVVRAVLDAFPGAEIEAVRDLVEDNRDDAPDLMDGDLSNGEED